MDKCIGQEFMDKTRYAYIQQTDQIQGVPQPALEVKIDPKKAVIDLPQPETFPEVRINLLEFIELRTSVRQYANKPISLSELAYLLWCTQGVKGVIPGKATFRTVPSAGARHALETYLLINNVEGLAPGLYRFLAIEHKLQEVDLQPGISGEITGAGLHQQFIRSSAVTFIWTAVASRMNWKYGERGYRYLHLDAGHVCQNLYLTAETIGCGACAIGAFDDEQINSILGIDGKEQFVIYMAAVGKK